MKLSLQQKNNIENTFIVLLQSLPNETSADQINKLAVDIIKSLNASLEIPSWGQQIKEYLLALFDNNYVAQSEEIKTLIFNTLKKLNKKGQLVIPQTMDSERRLEATRISKAPMRIQVLVDMESIQVQFTQMDIIYNQINDHAVEKNIEKFVDNIYIKEAIKNSVDVYTIFIANYQQLQDFFAFTQHLPLSDAKNLIFNQLKTFEDYNKVVRSASILNNALELIQFLLREDKHFLTVISTMVISEKIKFIKKLNTQKVKGLLFKKQIAVANLCEFDKTNTPMVQGFFANQKPRTSVKWNGEQIVNNASFLSNSEITNFIDLGYFEVRPTDNPETIQQRFVLICQKQFDSIVKLIKAKKMTKENVRNLRCNSEVELCKILLFLSTINSSETVINFILKHPDLLKNIMIMSQGETTLILSAMQCVEIRNILAAKHPVSMIDILSIWRDIPKRMSLLAALADPTIYNEMQRQESVFQHKNIIKLKLKMGKILEIGKLASHYRISRLLHAEILHAQNLLNHIDWDSATFIVIAQHRALLDLKERLNQKFADKLIKSQNVKQLFSILERLDDLKINLDLKTSINHVAITVKDMFNQASNFLKANQFVYNKWSDEFNSFCKDEYKKLNSFTENTSEFVDYYSFGVQYALFENNSVMLQKAFDCFVKVPEDHEHYVKSLCECTKIQYNNREWSDARYFCLLTIEKAKSNQNQMTLYNAEVWLKKINEALEGKSIPPTILAGELVNEEDRAQQVNSPRLH